MEKAEVVVEGAVMTSGLGKSAPVGVGVAVSGMTIFGIPLPDFVPLLTCIYLIVMIGHTGWKWYTEWRVRKKQEEADGKKAGHE